VACCFLYKAKDLSVPPSLVLHVLAMNRVVSFSEYTFTSPYIEDIGNMNTLSPLLVRYNEGLLNIRSNPPVELGK
jgi:hypothetical protein